MVVIALISTVFHAQYLFKSQLVYGIDGPYYLIQIRRIAETIVSNGLFSIHHR